MHWLKILFLALNCKNRTAKGKARLPRSSFVSRGKDQFPFWAQRSIMIATFMPYSKRTFSNVLQGVPLYDFLGEAMVFFYICHYDIGAIFPGQHPVLQTKNKLQLKYNNLELI